MNKALVGMVLSLTVISCSAPKYTYRFDLHDYNVGRKQTQAAREVASNQGPVAIQPDMLVAETMLISPGQSGEMQEASTPRKGAPLTISKSERKAMAKDLKAAVKDIVKARKSGDVVQVDQASSAMDNDLKLALIFLAFAIAAAALTALANVLWIVSAAATIVFIVFLVKWLMKQ